MAWRCVAWHCVSLARLRADAYTRVRVCACALDTCMRGYASHVRAAARLHAYLLLVYALTVSGAAWLGVYWSRPFLPAEAFHGGRSLDQSFARQLCMHACSLCGKNVRREGWASVPTWSISLSYFSATIFSSSRTHLQTFWKFLHVFARCCDRLAGVYQMTVWSCRLISTCHWTRWVAYHTSRSGLPALPSRCLVQKQQWEVQLMQTLSSNSTSAHQR